MLVYYIIVLDTLKKYGDWNQVEESISSAPYLTVKESIPSTPYLTVKESIPSTPYLDRRKKHSIHALPNLQVINRRFKVYHKDNATNTKMVS